MSSMPEIFKSTCVAEVRAKNKQTKQKIKTIRLDFQSRANMCDVNFKSNRRAYVCLLSKMREIFPTA